MKKIVMAETGLCRLWPPAVCIIIFLISGCRGPQAAGNEAWTVVELLTRGERTQAVMETVEVRHCPVPDRKTVECSAGTASNFSASLGASVGLSAGAQVTLDPSIGVELGFNRTSGQTLTLDTPSEGSTYVYVVKKEYRIISGKARVRAAGGQERDGAYVFEASCALRTESRRRLTCEGGEVTPAPAATASLTATSTPMPTVTSTPTLTPTSTPTRTSTSRPMVTPRPTETPVPTRPHPTATLSAPTPAPTATARPADTPAPPPPEPKPVATDSHP